ncbi:MAG: DEAD/DEAH box helicase family protein, partial [Endomicrobium sp.]|nr:DEAD/DEAH box helicase family protein [Endomicrobium sp.]
MTNMHNEKQEILDRLNTLEKEKIDLLQQLKFLETTQPKQPNTIKLSVDEKIKLFRSLFKGREDVYARRFENLTTNKSGYFHVKNKDAFVPVSNDIIKSHLQGYNEKEVSYYGNIKDFTIGIYPLLKDDTANFLAIDFDEENYKTEVKYFSDICKKLSLPAYIEISRSGRGAHIWFFFTIPIPAQLARKLGTFVLSKTMEEYPLLEFSSYDRMFPAQDFLPKGGLGNLIALPLQNKPRKNGFSVFVDDNFTPFKDQWLFLSEIKKISAEEIGNVLNQNVNSFDSLFDELSEKSNSKKEEKELLKDIILPQSVNAALSNMIYIDTSNIPPKLVSAIKKLAAFRNPEFHKFQTMRLPVYNKPRVISCAEMEEGYIALPRGCINALQNFLKDLNIKFELHDKRISGDKLQIRFNGKLRTAQESFTKKILDNDICIMSAPTAFGKTVIAANIISKRKINTLILVHRKQLLEQWRERLDTFLKGKKIQIGILGAGKSKANYKIDIAMLQTLSRQKNLQDIMSKYGQIIIDECHHIAAFSFEQAVKHFKGKYVLGISATPERKDGHQPIVEMQCGKVIAANEKHYSENISARFVNYKITDFEYSHDNLEISDIYENLYKNEKRNKAICDDIIKEYVQNKSCVVLTERKEHLVLL